VPQSDVQWEQAEGQLTTQLGRVWWKQRALARRQSRVGVRRCEGKYPCGGKCIRIGIEFTDWGDLQNRSEVRSY
jgi:hypothetical protein